MMFNPIFLITFSFSMILLGLMIIRRLWKSYPLFFGYFALVVGRDVVFLFIRSSSDQVLYSQAYYWSEPIIHLLRIAVIFNLYYILLREYRNLKKVTNIFFFGIQGLVVGLFLYLYNPAVYLLWFISIYLGRWSMLLALLLSVLILVIVRFSDIQLNPTYKYLVLGFLVFSGLQFLNFGYLGIFGDRYAAIWQKTYSLSWMIPKVLWFIAAWSYAARRVDAHPRSTIMLDHTQVIRGLSRLDRQVGHILNKIIPFRN